LIKVIKVTAVMISVSFADKFYQDSFRDVMIPCQKITIMISLTTIGDHYLFQRPLLSKHQETLEWLSAIVLWKSELSFFQKLLDRHVAKMSTADARTQAEHFQNVIIYFNAR
jgi:hypothetical protein